MHRSRRTLEQLAPREGGVSLPSNWCEAGKVRLRRFVVDFLRNLAQENGEKFAGLNSRLADLERQVHRGENLSTLLDEARAELEEFLSHQAQGAKLQAQVREAVEGESSRPAETDQCHSAE